MEITGGTYWDTIRADVVSEAQIFIANDVPVSGMSLGFTAYTPDSAEFELLPCSGPLEYPDCTTACIIPDTRAAQVPWTVACPSDPLPGQFYIAMTTTGEPMAAGDPEHMISFFFRAHGPLRAGDVRTLCFDTMFYPPDGPFLFVDAQQNSFVPDFNGPGCMPVAVTVDCWAPMDNDNPTEVTVDHSESVQVQLYAHSITEEPVKYRIYDVTDGDGTATVGKYTGLVTYTPAPEDVGKTVTVRVEAACLGMAYTGWNLWTLLVTVTNQPLAAGFGRTEYCAAIDHEFKKRDVDAYDPGGATPEFFLISGPGEVDPATGYYLWIPGVDDYGLHTIEMGVTDGYDTLSGSFSVDVRDVSCCPGDVNADCTVNIADAVYYIGYVFKGGPVPPVMNWADPNADCGPGMGDIVYIITYIFKGGPAPEIGCL